MIRAGFFATAALAVAGIFTQAAQAEQVIFTSCSRDGQSVPMDADVEGSLKQGSLKTLIQQALDRTAHSMDGNALVGIKGFYAVEDAIKEALKGKEGVKPTRIVLMPLTAGAPGCVA